MSKAPQRLYGLHLKAPHRKAPLHENDPLEHSELCMRVMDRFFAGVEDLPAGDAILIDLYLLYADVLQAELERYAFELAHVLFSDGASARRWRESRGRKRG